MNRPPVPVDLDPLDFWHGDPAELVAAVDVEPGLLLARIAASRPSWMSQGHADNGASTGPDQHGVVGGMSGRARRTARSLRGRSAA